MRIQAHIHGHKGQGHHIHEFQHKIWSVTQSRLINATSSKMKIDHTALIHMLMLLQCPNIIQNRVFYKEIWSTKPVGPQMLYTTHTAMESHKKAHQHKEHVSQSKCIKSYHKIIRDKREKSSRRTTRSRPRTPYLFTNSRVHQMVCFTLSSWTIWTQTYLGFVPIMGDYLIPIYIQVGSSFSLDIYQESITYVKIVSQGLAFTGFLKIECPSTCQSIILHNSHLGSFLCKLSFKPYHAYFQSISSKLWPFHQFLALRDLVFILEAKKNPS